jgi:hypothetical protein
MLLIIAEPVHAGLFYAAISSLFPLYTIHQLMLSIMLSAWL